MHGASPPMLAIDEPAEPAIDGGARDDRTLGVSPPMDPAGPCPVSASFASMPLVEDGKSAPFFSPPSTPPSLEHASTSLIPARGDGYEARDA